MTNDSKRILFLINFIFLTSSVNAETFNCELKNNVLDCSPKVQSTNYGNLKRYISQISIESCGIINVEAEMSSIGNSNGFDFFNLSINYRCTEADGFIKTTGLEKLNLDCHNLLTKEFSFGFDFLRSGKSIHWDDRGDHRKSALEPDDPLLRKQNVDIKGFCLKL
jgi:hypothetical protein